MVETMTTYRKNGKAYELTSRYTKDTSLEFISDSLNNDLLSKYVLKSTHVKRISISFVDIGKMISVYYNNGYKTEYVIK